MASAVSTPSISAGWSFTPVAQQRVEFDTNPLLVPRSSNFYVNDTANLATNLVGKLDHHDEQLDLTASPRLLFQYYPDTTFLDQNNQYLDLAANYKLERTSWAGTAKLARDTTLTSELGTTGLTIGNRRHENATLALGPTYQVTERFSLSAQGGYERNRYENEAGTGLIDYTYYSGDAKASYLASARTQLNLDVAVNRLHVAALGFGTTSYIVVAGLTSALNERWSATVSAGPSFVKSSRGTDNGFTALVEAKRTGELLNLDARVSRDLTPTGRGVLTTRDQALLSLYRPISERLISSISLLYQRTRDLTTNPFGANDYILIYCGTAASCNLPSFAPYTVHYYSAEANLRWQFSPQWELSPFARYEEQDIYAASTRAHGYRVGLTLSWNGRPYGFW